eukprot:2006610-Rhodomonas_salina.1
MYTQHRHRHRPTDRQTDRHRHRQTHRDTPAEEREEFGLELRQRSHQPGSTIPYLTTGHRIAPCAISLPDIA